MHPYMSKLVTILTDNVNIMIEMCQSHSYNGADW